nr:phosphatase PAP2 family protein [Psychromicrobium silvestre]
MAVSAAVSNIIKHLVGRHRPPIADMATGANHSYSFPSGHTLGISVFIFTLAYLVLSRRFSAGRLLVWLLGAVVGIILVGLSRIYLGYHWLTDVSASVLLAAAFLGIVILVDVFRPKRADMPFRKSSTPATEPTEEPQNPADTNDQR